MQLSVVDENTPKTNTLSAFHQCRLARLKHFVWLTCLETIHFSYIVLFDVLEFQRFCFQGRSCHSFHFSSSWCEYTINHFTEFITDQNFLGSFSSHGISYIKGVETTFGVWSFLIILTKQTANSGLKIQKKKWTKGLQKLPRQYFTFLS